MTRWMTLSMAALFMAAVSIQAQDAALAAPTGKPAKHEKKADRPQVAAEPISATGTLSKEQKKGREGVEKTIYVVTTAEGAKLTLTPNEAVTAAILDVMVGKNVKVVGTGNTMERGGKKFIHLKTLTSVVLT